MSTRMNQRLPLLHAALVVVLPTVTGCGAGFTVGPENGRCVIRVDHVHESRGAPGQMGGKALLRCDVEVAAARLVVQLQRERNGSWQLVRDHTTDTGRFAPLIGVLDQNKPATRQVFVGCAPGVYRLAARGSAALDGVPSESPAWEYSAATADPCAADRR